MEDLELKSAEQVQDDVAKESTKVGIISKPEAKEVNQQSKTSSSSTEQDLDAFLLGDPGDTDDSPGRLQCFIDLVMCSLGRSAKRWMHLYFVPFFLKNASVSIFRLSAEVTYPLGVIP
jgi:hypothetical protein